MEPNITPVKDKSLVDSTGGLHECRYCGKSFTRRSYLSCHIIAHKFPALQCDVCCRQFGRVDSLRRHRCSATASNSKTLSVNSSATGATIRHTCPSCQKSYTRRETLLQHIVRHHQELLDDSSGQQKAVEAHPCIVCHRVYASSLSLRNHEVLIHGGRSLADSEGFSCGGCGRQFVSQLNVDRHVCPNSALQQDDTEPPISSRQQQTTSKKLCATKSGTVESNCNLYDGDEEANLVQEAIAATVVAKRSTCQFCGRTFSSFGWLHRHVTAAHADQATAQSREEVSSIADQSQASSGHVCPVCGKALSSVGNLNKHLLTHGPRREMCPECGHQFHQRATLRQHVRDVHASPGSFAVECPTCGLRMRSRNSLYAHIARFHAPSSSSRPHHVCGICGRTFHQRGNLRKHEKTHQVDALYVCPDCPRRLRTAERLKRHQTWHRQGAEFACASCGHRFVQPSDLRRHIAFRHSATNNTYRCCYCGVCCRHYQVCSVGQYIVQSYAIIRTVILVYENKCAFTLLVKCQFSVKVKVLYSR